MLRTHFGKRGHIFKLSAPISAQVDLINVEITIFSYKEVRDSGGFYRAFLEEQITGEQPSFREYAIGELGNINLNENFAWDTMESRIARREGMARSEYNRWKAALLTPKEGR